MVKNELCARGMFKQFELCDGIDARCPIDNTPTLHNPLIWHKFNLTANYVPKRVNDPPGSRLITVGLLPSDKVFIPLPSRNILSN